MLDEFQRNEALIHFQRGLVLERAHRVQEAVEEYRRAIAHDPHLREAHGALGLYYQRHGLLAKAAEEFRVVANLEDDFLSHFNLGYVLLELKRYDEALDVFGHCLELAPEDPATHYEIGCIRYARGEYEAAIEELKRPLARYPDDWEVHNLIGRCDLRLGRYDEALAAFSRALRVATRLSSQADVIRSMQMVERYREFDSLASAKDRLYADEGVVCLGSAQDDGLQLEESQDYHFTYPDIGATVQRFVAVCQGCGWRFSSVVALDRLARPLASALAALLDVPQREADDVQAGELPLLVMAIGREAELLELAIERIPGELVTFCLGLNWLRHRQLLPDITGVIVRGACSVPWEAELRRLRADGADPERIAACLSSGSAHILAAARETPDEPNGGAQVAYYAHDHVRLRFSDAFEGVVEPAGA